MKTLLATLILAASAIAEPIVKKPDAATDFPPPIEGKIYTLDGVAKARVSLTGKVIRLKFTTFFKQEQIPGGFKIYVHDDYVTGGGGSDYVYFPPEAVAKLEALTSKTRNIADGKAQTMSFYVLVREDTLLALGRSVSRDIRGKATYVW